MSQSFDIRATQLPEVLLLQRRQQADARGWFERMYSSDELATLLGTGFIAQINHTLTRRKATVRGLHYQVSPSAEAKIITCLRGSVFDVAVDLRRGSPTFLQWHAETLRGVDQRSLLIPEGFAHGFQALEDDCELLYFHSAPYDPAAERGVRADDSRVGIAWPLQVEHLSDRDTSHPLLEPAFEGIVL